MGMAAGLLGTGANMAGSIMDMNAKKKAQQQQQENLNNWYMGQAALRHQEMMRQSNLGFQAGNAFRQNLYDTAGGLAQASQQQKEQNRLQQAYAGGTSASEYAQPASDASIQAGSQRGALAGQSGGDGEFRTDLARRLNNAAGDARNKIAALATMNSYGDSQYGLGNVVPMGFQQAGQEINKFNNFRRGSLQAYGVEKAIEPVQVQHNGSAGAMGAKALGGLLSGLGGGGGGGGMF
jgi:hypothetical protein